MDVTVPMPRWQGINAEVSMKIPRYMEVVKTEVYSPRQRALLLSKAILMLGLNSLFWFNTNFECWKRLDCLVTGYTTSLE